MIDKNDITIGTVYFNRYNDPDALLAINHFIKSFKKFNLDYNNIIIIEDIIDQKYKLQPIITDNYISVNNILDIDITEQENIIKTIKGMPGDASHQYHIDYLISLCKTKYLILCDYDILFKQSLDSLINDFSEFDIISDFKTSPFLLLLNIEKLKHNNFKFFDPTYAKDKILWYRTCGNLQEYITNNIYSHKLIDINQYIIHYGGISWGGRSQWNLNPEGSIKIYIPEEIYNIKTYENFLKIYYNLY